MNIIRLVVDCFNIKCDIDIEPLHKNTVSTGTGKKINDVNTRQRAQSAKLRKFATLNNTKERVLRSGSQGRRITPQVMSMIKKER